MADRTHYDTLKVTQDAPDEVIAAAYKALAKMYHPDKTGNDPAAVTLMQSINISYNVLSDPQKRAEHDLWISQHERRREPRTADKGRRRAEPTSGGGGKQAKADKAVAEAQKWIAWSERAAQEAKEAQAKVDKAMADLAKAKPADRAKWEAWIARTQQEAKEAKDKAEKAAAQSAKAMAEAQAALTEAKGG